MDEFLKIKTVFDNFSKRTVEELSKRYINKQQLKKDIFDLVYEPLLKNDNLKGKKLLLKPNWVKHSSLPFDDICLRTNDNFLLVFLEILLECSPRLIIIGDSPIQGCKWDKMLSEQFLSEIKSLSYNFNTPVHIKDFRRVTLESSKNLIKKDCNPLEKYQIFDLGVNSFLEPISDKNNTFRITHYNPDRLKESHRKGVHKYCITKDIFDVDVIISIPKIKTHQKTGITCALKNIVGINGDKDFLPHYRLGGTGHGGDCYPGNNYFRYYSEKLTDIANRNIGKPVFWFWQKLSILLWKLSNPKQIHQLGGGWYANDTCWRMVMDLNKIVIFGTPDGKISDYPQRRIYSLCDGIIGGQGNGPLSPIPLPLGITMFSNTSEVTDIAVAILLGFNADKFLLFKSVNTKVQHENLQIILNDKKININDLKSFEINTIPPPGWADYLNNNKIPSV